MLTELVRAAKALIDQKQGSVRTPVAAVSAHHRFDEPRTPLTTKVSRVDRPATLPPVSEEAGPCITEDGKQVTSF